METAAEQPRSLLLERIRSDVSRGEVAVHRLARLNTRLVLGSLVASAFGSVLAGIAASAGPPLGTGDVAWRWTCGVIAIVVALAAMLTGAQQRFGISERLASARSFTAQLRALELSLGLRGREMDDVATQYTDILARHPEVR